MGSRIVRAPVGGTGTDHLPSNVGLRTTERNELEPFSVRDREVKTEIVWKRF